MQNKSNIKSFKSKEQLMSQCKVNKYLSAGQVEKLERLTAYELEHDGFTYDDGDNWFI